MESKAVAVQLLQQLWQHHPPANLLTVTGQQLIDCPIAQQQHQQDQRQLEVQQTEIDCNGSEINLINNTVCRQ